MSISLSHEELRELLGVYALDAVEPDERAAIEAHLGGCPACRAEVAEHREVASLLAHSGAPAPAGLWDRISSSLEPAPPALHLAHFTVPDAARGAEGDATGVAPVASLAARRDRSVARRGFVAMAAAAVLAVVVLGVVVVRQNRRLDKVNAALSAVSLDQVVDKAMRDPHAQHVSLHSADGKMSVTAVVTAQGVGYLDTARLPVLHAGRTYQLWGVKGKVVISLGIFTAGARAVPFQTNGALDALAITEEVGGGVVSSVNQPVVSGKVI